jgi:hypothetical protein
MFALVAQPVLADGQGSPTECLDTTEGVTGGIEGTQDAVTYEAPDGEIVTGVCIKTGESEGHTGLITADGEYFDCYTVSGIGTDSVTVTRTGAAGPECQGISHIDVRTELAGNIIIEKDDVSGSGQSFEFDSNYGANFFLADGQTNDSGDLASGQYTVAELVPAGFDLTGIVCDDGNSTGDLTTATATVNLEAGETVTCVFTNDEEVTEEPTGSITIDKQLGECEVCEAYTPGYWFNRGGGGGVDWANTWLMANPQVIDGVGTFDSVADVQAYLDADRADGGLSATGQLLRHYLALVLNVAFANVNDCDLGSLVYGDMTVAEWRDAALTALETGASDGDKREIKDALDAINNSNAGDGTLECGDTEVGAHAGVMFELYNEGDELVDSGTTGGDGSLLLDGNPDGTGLPLGTYTLVETTNDEDLVCSIVSVSGEGATLNEDGTVTIVLTDENAHVSITVVNECEEQPGEEDEFGHISVIKETDEGEPAESFAFTATWDEEGFTLMDGDLEPSGDLLAGADYTVTEVLTEAQIAAGWSLDDLDCEGAEAWTVSEDGMSVTITLGADEDVVCTFTNEFDEGENEVDTVEVSIMKHLCADVATVAEFEAIEAAAAEENPENALAPLVATVLACPTIVLTGDVPTDGAVSGGAIDFEFSVQDADGTQLMSEDGMFMQGALCETDVNLDADGDGEITSDVCLDVSHYSFEVVDGLVVITETDAPDAHRFGTIRFTPGSDDADALVGTITSVEASGRITLDTRADADDTVMVHVYNFVLEDTQGGGGGGTQKPKPNEGTLGGNPLPNTAFSPIPTGSVPAALLALLMLSGLGAAAYAVKAEVRRRR